MLVHLMEGSSSSYRSSLGFPVGTAVLLLVIFSLTGIFSCCYHWDKLRRRATLVSADAKSHHLDLKPAKQHRSSLPVIMPGDSVPRFIALPCPCEPPRPPTVVLHVQNLPSAAPRIAVPLY
ncbi:uncharacterized protein At5g65660-like isoform X2 [Andrographis paniculata]|uniref:uncharacterized protein At5g65660-like isoform X2 n=1 Tax=Andrographis paniculata TaxID=175694 RepID=UPI0021E70887|nr:uncharacterized protein At5g65660-like isoform X2 [Andrographis paniculata]